MTVPLVSYQLRRFETSADPDFANALALYVRLTPPNSRTETAEISHWVDHFKSTFGNDFYVFGFYLNGQLVGFAEAAYFSAARLIVLDYLVIDEFHRKHNVFFEFVDHLRRFLESSHAEYRYAIAEVCYDGGSEAPTRDAVLRSRLLRLQGFRRVRALYIQPRLLIGSVETGPRADLLLFAPAPIETIPTETYLQLVRAIYYDYYLAWKTVLPNELIDYRRHLDETYAKVVKSTRTQQAIRVNGHSMNAPSERPSVHRVVSFVGQAVAVILLMLAGLLGLKSLFHLSDRAVLVLASTTVVSFIALAGIVSRNARSVFREVLGVVRAAIRKNDPNAGAGTAVVLETPGAQPALPPRASEKPNDPQPPSTQSA
jgi:hypothetical protein